MGLEIDAPLRDSSGLNGDELRARADVDGYLFWPSLLKNREVLALRRVVLAECAKLGWLRDPPEGGVGHEDPGFIRLQCAALARPECDALRRHPRVLAVLGAIFEGPVECGRGDVLRVFFPNAPDRTTPPHQDLYYVSSPGIMWNVWIPLGDCPLQLGPLSVWPGSHRCGLLAHSPDVVTPAALAGARWQASDLRCGDVLMVHYATVHRACPNRTASRLRLSVDFRYMAALVS